MTPTPDPYSLTPHGTVPDQAAELNQATVGRLNGVLLSTALKADTTMGIYPVDRTLAARIEDDVPGYGVSLAAQRMFLDKALEFMAKDRGIDQFVILRAGLPLGPKKTEKEEEEETEHSLVQTHLPAATTLLVARETVPCAHQTLVLERQEQARAATVLAPVHDVHGPLHALHGPENWSLDLGKPVGLTMVGDPAHWPGDVTDLMRAYHEELPPGSVIGVNTLGTAPPGSAAAAALDDLARHLAFTPEPQLTPRSQAEVESWFDGTGWTLEPPGVAPGSQWARPQPADIAGPELPAWGAVATRDAS
ncbi:SAM-dependent methyltransferase [Amycolatopsis roodepoortensis]|uniref:SAM-dependent methyltransferase n=1 Tax=Amycolatopsis roodepoortensis TaxID=700274 RepID=UPI00214D0160|nr:SAM-dependent methyltransferase [Amycolatopsis roodepoortensis]UUV32239.1 SAM-dependent methyltransferase [Amycolatopsis roodepoortensis]